MNTQTTASDQAAAILDQALAYIAAGQRHTQPTGSLVGWVARTTGADHMKAKIITGALHSALAASGRVEKIKIRTPVGRGTMVDAYRVATTA
jgi:hypothetical protein